MDKIRIPDFWINVDTPEKSRRVQEIVFATGHGWGGPGKTTVDYTDSPWLHFTLWPGEPEPVITHCTEGGDGCLTVDYDDFVKKYGHLVNPCNTGGEDAYDG